MAESSTKAFGRYLKTLRERRNLSLDDVASLSQTFPEKINKGYLSRCENGHQKLAFSKVIALSRIFEVPADVLVERMELDLELDRVGGPETEGMSYAELTEAGKKVIHQGFYIRGYGLLRDAIHAALAGPIKPIFKTADEQLFHAQLNCGTAARLLGHHRFALHEFKHLAGFIENFQEFEPLLLERISGCYLALKEYPLAEQYADSAIEKAERKPADPFIGHLYYTRARLSIYKSEAKTAALFFQKAYDAFKDAGCRHECALALNSLSQCHVELKRYQAARRTAKAAMKIAQELRHPRSRALSLMMLGLIDETEKRTRAAKIRWKEAVEIAKKLRDKELRFKAEFMLYKQAMKDRNAAVARAISRRLQRLAPSIPVPIDEVDEFRQLVASGDVPARHSVSIAQRDLPASGN